MKKVLPILMLTSTLLWAETDISLYNDLSSAYSSGFYPGVVEYARRLEKKYPDSSLKSFALVKKGECLARLGLMKEAEPVLIEALKLVETDAGLKNECRFWLAKVYENLGEKDLSLQYYFEYCEDTRKYAFDENYSGAVYYPESVLSAGKIYYYQKEYRKAVSLFEYVVENGNLYSQKKYSEGLVLLCDSYNKLNESQKTISLYDKISVSNSGQDKSSLESAVYFLVVEYAGDAYLLQKNYRKAYELYCDVLASGERSLAANALKKAYNVSSLHKKEVGMEPGAVLSHAQETLMDQKDLLGEFWTRLGADAFDSGDYSKAVSYFDEAKKNPSDMNQEFASLYLAQIASGENPTAESARKGQQILLDYREGKEKLYFEREGNILLVKYYAAQGKWDELKSLALSISPSDDVVSYYYGIACYNTGDFSAASALFAGNNTEGKALSFAKQQKLKEAASVYEKILEDRDLSNEEKLNYSKILLLSGRYREAQIVAAKCPLNEAKYILGLAQFNTWSWPYAEENFSAFLKNGGKVESSTVNESDKSFASYARFYLGYSQYRQSKNDAAISNLDEFTKKFPNHELAWNGYMTAANASVQLGRYDSAIKYAESAIRKSNNTNREDAVLLCASIHKDAGHSENAIALLEPYSKLKSDFGMASLYSMGRIYEEQGDLKRADLIYKNVTTSFAGKKLSEEAMYRRGEMYYNAQDYGSALDRFTSYSSKNPNGIYLDASWYYTADCLAKTDKKNRAVLQFQALIKRFPASTYVYDSAKNLIELYREQENYSNALDYCALLLNQFPKQAEDDGIKDVSVELEKLSNGASEEIVKAETEYRKAGESSTFAGRHIGTRLCQLYSQRPSYAARSVSFAEKLLAIQEKYLPDESADAALNAILIANSYRASGKNEVAAHKYLDAVKYSRQAGDPQAAAQSLYSAYDAFRAAGKIGDGNATAKQLKQLYPDSVQAKKVIIE